MAYSRKNFINYTAPSISSANLNDMDQAIYETDDALEKFVYAKSPTFISGKSISASTGNASDNPNYSCSDFIECEQGDMLLLSNVYSSTAAAYAFYKSDKTFISAVSNVDGTGKIIAVNTIPSNAKYVRFCSKSSDRTFAVCLVDNKSVEALKAEVSTLDGEVDYLQTSDNFLRTHLFLSKNATFKGGYINIAAAVGSTVSLTPIASNDYEYVLIPCEKDQKIVITTHGGSTPRAYGFVNSSNVLLEVAEALSNYTNKVLYAPADGYFVCNNKVEYTTRSVVYESNAINDKFPVDTSGIKDNAITPIKASFFELSSKNMVNPDNLVTDKRFQTGSAKIIDSSGDSFGSTGFIDVVEGETYTYNGTALSDVYQGGYFTEDATLTVGEAGTVITWTDTPNEVGKSFTVPTGQGITKVLLTYSKTVQGGVMQLEKGDTASEYTPYEMTYRIPERYLDVSGGGGTEVSDIVKLPSVNYDSFELNKISSFREHWEKKDKDLMVVGVGTSLTARSRDHYSIRPDANKRPPLMDANNLCSLVWDKIKWDGQEYRRYDYPDFFTEVGTFTSARDVNDWDEAGYRSGYTRYSDSGGSVTFDVPDDAWQFNFIYRTDSLGCESCSVSIAEGNGYMEVWNGSAWVEANGYTFSERETVQYLSNITVPNPMTVDNAKNITISSYKISSNSMYQKRLKMRCANHRDVTKTVTISANSDRFMYWGVEWSPREFMITYVNNARGSHNMTVNSDRGLQHFQDNEIWAFKPDLIFTENPIHNSGGSGSAEGFSSYPTTYWEYITYDFFFNEDSPVSLKSRAEANGITDLEWVIFTSSVAWNFGGINDEGELKVTVDNSGHAMDALEAQTRAYLFSKNYQDESIISINACKYWCDACWELYGDLKTATLGSGQIGNTLTDEGSHWNDKGNEVIAKCVVPVFEFCH